MGRIEKGNLMNIDDLKSTFNKHGGLAVTNKFNVIFTPPAQSLLNLDFQSIASQALSGGFDLKNLVNDPRDISLLCQKVNLPGRSLSTAEYAVEEQQNSYPYDFIDDDCKMEFIATNDMYIRRMFDNWMEGIYSPAKHIVGYKDDYAVDVVIQMLNKQEIPIYGVRLEKAYPKSVSGFDLNQGKEDLTTLTVEWKYDKFVPEGALSSSVSAANAVLDLIT